MKFGLTLAGLGARHCPEVAEVAEANGFDSVWLPEQLIFPATMPAYDNGLDPNTPVFDPLIVLASIASRTTSIKLATGVYVLPLRHPVIVARSVITLDRMSAGRVLFGVGVGWLPDEARVVDQNFTNRGRRTDEMIQVMRALWTEDTIEFHGEHYDVPPVKFQPKPVDRDRGIPILVGGLSAAALRRAGHLGDGWVHHADIETSTSPDGTEAAMRESDWVALEQALQTIGRHRREAGREHLPFDVVGTVGTSRAAVHRAEELGVSTIVVGPSVPGMRGSKSEFVDWIRRYADEVIGQV